MAFTLDDVLEVLKIIKECDDAELRIETDDLKLVVVKGRIAGSDLALTAFAAPAEPAPASPPTHDAQDRALGTAAAATPAAPAQGDAEILAGLVPVRATVTSVFYRKPSPDEPPFVEVGSEVSEDTIVCLLEVMKCYYSVPAGVRGRIEKILIQSGDLVEDGAPMFLVKPA